MSGREREASEEEEEEGVYTVTPLVYSERYSSLCGRKVFLKMDNEQPSGSFKYRGISLLCQRCGASQILTFAFSLF
jgi:threonine dehydratase